MVAVKSTVKRGKLIQIKLDMFYIPAEQIWKYCPYHHIGKLNYRLLNQNVFNLKTTPLCRLAHFCLCSRIRFTMPPASVALTTTIFTICKQSTVFQIFNNTQQQPAANKLSHAHGQLSRDINIEAKRSRSAIRLHPHHPSSIDNVQAHTCTIIEPVVRHKKSHFKVTSAFKIDILYNFTYYVYSEIQIISASRFSKLHLATLRFCLWQMQRN